MTALRVLPQPRSDLVQVSSSEVLPELLDPLLTREGVLDRIDPATLRSAPLNLLISTAMSIAAPDTLAATEDAVLRYTEALTGVNSSLVAHARLSAENLVLANVEYQSAISAYAAAECSGPIRSDWKNPQHFLEAMRIHERRMDRLLRARKEAYERVEKTSELYREAVLTRDGLEVLRSVSTPSPREQIPQAPAGDRNIFILVQ